LLHPALAVRVLRGERTRRRTPAGSH
jgi:hypothetical protein